MAEHPTTRSAALVFSATALLHLAALVTRFTDVAVHVPDSVAAAILFAHFPLLLVEGFLEGRIDYGETTVDLPLWMRIRSRPVKLSFTFAFTYLAVTVLQTWDISIGPIDPTPPPEWSLGMRAYWFGIMSVGMFFPNYLAATSLLIPPLRAITSPLRRLPVPVAVALAGVVGAAAGWGVLALLGSQEVGGAIAGVQSALSSSPEVTVGVTLALILVPLALELLSRDTGD